MLTLRAASLFSLTPLALLLGGAALAQARITQALVYPGGAEVQRVVPVTAGAREVVFSCIPDSYEASAFHAKGLGDIRVGELRIETLPAAAAPQCSGDSALDAQIRTLEDAQAGLSAERGALDLVLAYLKNTGGGDAKGAAQPATAEAIRRQGLEALKQQHGLQRRSEEVDKQLKPLLAQREQERGSVSHWLRVSVRVQAAQAGSVQLTGRTSQAGWQPSYRADLDSAAARVQFERRAEVQQATGEAWRDVKLVLSTRQPNRAMSLPDPQPWLLAKVEPMARQRALAMAAPAPAFLPAPPMKVGEATLFAPLPSFESDIDLQFTVPGSTTLASGAERRELLLERLSWSAKLVTQVQPSEQPQAYLMATLKRPEGFFPAGSVQLLRDGDFVGSSLFNIDTEAEQRLFFGPDDRLRVRVEPQQKDAGNTGFIGSRRVVAVKRAYVLENTSGKPLAVQVVEAGPQAQHEDIQVQAKLNPAPAVNAWRDLPGVRLWQLNLAPKQSQRLTADYELSAPKDMAVTGWP